MHVKDSHGNLVPQATSRRDEFTKANREPPIWDSIGGDYLLKALNRIGFYSHFGEGRCVLTWAEIHAFAQATQAVREPWEMEALRRMSSAYLGGLRQGENVFGIIPGEEPE